MWYSLQSSNLQVINFPQIVQQAKKKEVVSFNV